jgi:hypothetical protein
VIALHAGDLGRARTLAATNPDADRIDMILDAWAGDPEAKPVLLAAADASSRDATLHGWAALIAARDGDEEVADRFRRLAVFNWEGAELPGRTFGIAPGTGHDGLEGIPAGTRSAFYGEWLYRRGMPIDLTPPGLPRPIYTDLELPADDEDGGSD